MAAPEELTPNGMKAGGEELPDIIFAVQPVQFILVSAIIVILLATGRASVAMLECRLRRRACRRAKVAATRLRRANRRAILLRQRGRGSEQSDCNTCCPNHCLFPYSLRPPRQQVEISDHRPNMKLIVTQTMKRMPCFIYPLAVTSTHRSYSTSCLAALRGHELDIFPNLNHIHAYAGNRPELESREHTQRAFLKDSFVLMRRTSLPLLPGTAQRYQIRKPFS